MGRRLLVALADVVGVVVCWLVLCACTWALDHLLVPAAAAEDGASS